MPPVGRATDTPESRPSAGLRRSSQKSLVDAQSDVTSSDVTSSDEASSDDENVVYQLPLRPLLSQTYERQVYDGSATGGTLKSRRPAPWKSYTRSIIISGVKVQPTVVYDTFWRFAAERKAIDDRRRSGMPQPWTDDPILRKYPFCNTYRVLDKLSQYIIREVIEKGSQVPSELVFRVALFNMFTKIETWELLKRKLGPLTWPRYRREDYGKVLTTAKRSGVTLYTGAFQKPAPHFGYVEAHMNHLCLLEIFMENDLAGRLLNARYMADAFEYLASFPSMGKFSTYQLMLNLSYSRVLNFSSSDFVILGPGASSGLKKMFGAEKLEEARKVVPCIDEAIIRWMVKHQDLEFKRLGLEFSGLGPDRLPLDLADIEHLLCEVDKYSRKKHPHFRGKRTEMRGVFHASAAAYPPKPVLPKAWSHPARKTARIRSGGPPVIEKRYEISRIGDHRKGTSGMEFKVYWRGYPDSDATWEPKGSLMADAPLAVKEYMDRHHLSYVL